MRQRGKWVNNRGIAAKIEYDCNGHVTPVNAKCSICGEWLVGSDELPTIGNFCPCCGAYMGGNKTEKWQAKKSLK